MHRHHDLADLLEVESTGSRYIIDVIDHLDFTKMIAGTKAPRLFDTSLYRCTRHGIRISASEPALLFCDLEVRSLAIALLNSPGRPAHHDGTNLIDTHLTHPRDTHTR